jgi:hypothetical protein
MGIISSFIVTKRGTGNTKSFLLARTVKPRRLTTVEIDRIGRAWFEKSRPLLPKGDTLEEFLPKFHDQLRRVRFTEMALEAACERAKTAHPPLIPACSGDTELARLAALCRELQRNARDRAFICPINIAQSFLNLRWPTQAKRLLDVLEEEGVIKCVERGAPNKPNEKGKPTFYRYFYPL